MNPTSLPFIAPLTSAKVGGLFDEILRAFSVGVSTVGALGGGNAGGQQVNTDPCGHQNMSDQGIIAGCIDALAAQYQQAQASLPPDQLLQVAQAILQMLNDPQRFNQNSHDAYLAQAKDVITREINRLGGSAGGGVKPPTGGGGSSIMGGGGSTINVGGVSVDSNTLLLVGGGLLVVFLLSRR